MGALTLPARGTYRLRTLCVLAFVIVVLWCARSILRDAWTLAALPVIWGAGAERFMMTDRTADFDITFANYSVHQVSAAPWEDRVPPIIHHIAMGGEKAEQFIAKWQDARKGCIDLHPEWQSFLWTDDKATAFVARHFPELRDMWENYRYPIQRIDALRYMILYHYGGVVLDMDLKCRRSLGPLRRFDFVAPAAHPTGFSVGFMMASQHNEFVGALVRNLANYNHHWLLLPYPTVMFSTGCHFASTIHAYQRDRSGLKVLGGTRENPKLHNLNKHVYTPLFEHLGTSAWHSYDAAMIYVLGNSSKQWMMPVLLVGGGAVAFLVIRRAKRRRALKV